MNKLMLLLGRISLSLIFVTSAVKKIFTWDQTVQYMTDSLSRWIAGTPTPDVMPQLMPNFIEQMMTVLSSHVIPVIMTATLFEGIGGLLVLLGFKVRFGATLLILFIIPVTVIMHPFWLVEGQDKMMEITMFMKNLAIFGGLLILAATKDGVSEG